MLREVNGNEVTSEKPVCVIPLELYHCWSHPKYSLSNQVSIYVFQKVRKFFNYKKKKKKKVFLASYVGFPVLDSQIKWINVSFHLCWSVFNFAILKQCIWLNKKITSMFIRLSRDPQHFPNFILSMQQCSNWKSILLHFDKTAVYTTLIFVLPILKWKISQEMYRNHKVSFKYTIETHFDNNERVEWFLFFFYYVIKYKCSTSNTFFFITFYLMGSNISLEIFTLTS